MPVDQEETSNPTTGTSFEEIVNARLTRRKVLGGALGSLAIGFLSGPSALAQSSRLGFSALPVSQDDTITVPEGYVASILYAWGDPVSNGPAFDFGAANSAEEQAAQAGMHHDGIHFFPLPYGSATSDHGLLVMNHEYTDEGLLHPDGAATMTPAKVRKSQAAHGVSVIEVRRTGDRWEVVRPSTFGRRITGYTPMRVSGPAAGDAQMRTLADPSGTVVLGTLNNCAHGYTPWGTYLACEENFNQYFAQRGTATPAQARLGIPTTGFEYRWFEHDGRFDAQAHPNEFNRFGWVVEIDPYDPTHTPVKRTALGRFKHEGATVTLATDGRVVVYMGDDERFEYVYKFVSRDRYNASSRAANSNILDEGTLYVARYEASGNGQWIALTQGQNGLDAASGFATQADVLVKARAAADKVGATRMDRPEWVAVDPNTKDVFLALTNNSQRGDSGRPATDAANPRRANVYGHIVRWRETGADAAALAFRWDIFVLGGDPRQADATKRGNVKGDAFGSPDGLWIDSRGTMWIQTDVSSSVLYTGDYVNLGNNQMLAADTATGEIRRFLTGPRNCEVTGVITTPDLRTMFVNIQHPGEPPSGFSDPATPARFSSWPDGPGVNRPRSATVVIQKRDGGIIGA